MAAPLTTDAPPLLVAIKAKPGWMARGECVGVDPDLFFPDRGEVTKPAKAVCSGCEVREACLEYALAEPIERFGIWGGKSERERRKIRRDRAAGRP